MWNPRADPGRTAGARPRRVLGALVGLLLLAVPLAGCSAGGGPDEAPQRGGGSPAAGLTQVTAPDVVRELTRLLQRRVEAVLAGDRRRFLAGVAPAAREGQGAYFDNLAQLPVAAYDVALDRRALVRDHGDYRGEVEVTLQLEGYDRVPVTTRDRYTFTPVRRGRLRLAATSDTGWEQAHGVLAQPWDAGPVRVVEGAGVLVVLDDGSAAGGRRLVRDLQDAVSSVLAEVPAGWDGRVVLYALSDPAFLSGLEDVPGEDPVVLDAVTVPVAARPGSEQVAGYRVVLNPRLVLTPGSARSRLLRHELTHVALGDRQDGVPTWFTEGLAEYVSVQALAPERRVVSGEALDAAERGLTSLPDDESFEAPEQGPSRVRYAVSWWACEYVAATYDPSTLWLLLGALAGEDPDRVLSDLLGLDEARLARKAGRLMLATYRPAEAEEDGAGGHAGRPGREDESSAGASDGPSGGTSGEPSDGE